MSFLHWLIAAMNQEMFHRVRGYWPLSLLVVGYYQIISRVERPFFPSDPAFVQGEKWCICLGIVRSSQAV